MALLTICALAAGYLQGHSKPADKPLGPSSHVYVSPVDKNVGMSDADIARFLARRTVPAGVFALLKPLKGTSKVNEKSSMNAVLVVTASPKLRLSVFMFKPTVTPDLRGANPVWTAVVPSNDVRSGLAVLVRAWIADHGQRTRKE